MPYDAKKVYSPDDLEYYDSLSFRFEKSVEIVINFFRGLEIFLFSKSSDTLRDRLLIVQKLDLIDNIDFWMEARLLRNKISHAYLPDQLEDIYEDIIKKSQTVFECMKRLEKYIEEKIT